MSSSNQIKPNRKKKKSKFFKGKSSPFCGSKNPGRCVRILRDKAVKHKESTSGNNLETVW
jgi:hypothetical protein